MAEQIPAVQAFETRLRRSRIVPILTITELRHAVPLARALVAGGLPILEVTLRTPVALDAARAIMAELPEAIIGLGTLLEPSDIERAVAMGAHFAVSPGSTPALLQAAAKAPLPFLPGVATSSEVMWARDLGFRLQKFFPAEAAGGIAWLKGILGPLPEVAFCPTGGIGPQNLAAYLALPNVPAVGGSWLTPAAEVEAGLWARITARAREARQAAAKPGEAG
jgi:2-dehydro-3-deoxyphosphogluconate aldolase / (4S)-4-hydroxy-2-oxoglutarate aldolase